MGQKTEFILADWDFPEEESASTETTSELSDMDLFTDIEEDFSLLEQSLEPLDETHEPAAEGNNASEEVKIVINKSSVEKPMFDFQGNKLHFNGNEINQQELTQEEEAFKRQIEDLFELLEMEKSADKNDGIRVYQTDSSPSRPWRFH